MNTPAYAYRASVNRVIDGDTLELTIDLGFSVFTKAIVRLQGINCSESNTEKGRLAKHSVDEWLTAQTGSLTVETVKDKREKYGRMLAKVYGANGRTLNDYLLKRNLAQPYLE
jgi:micrococcal nuclease